MKATFGVFYDGSPNSQKALEQAQFMLQGFPQGTLHICVCVNQPNLDPPFGYLPSEAEEIIRADKKKAATLLEPVAAQLHEKKIAFSTDIEVGDARSHVIGFCEKYDIKFLVLGSRGFSGLKGFLLGSTSQYAVANAPCTVVIAK